MAATASLAVPPEVDLNLPLAPTINPAARGWLDAHGDALFGFAMLRVRDRDVAEDLLQETLLAAMSATFSGRAAERTWLIGILRHKIVDHLRRQARKQANELAPADTFDVFTKKGKWRTPVRAWRCDPVALLELSEFRGVLAGCLSKLPGQLARAFWLREVDDVATDALCKELAVNPTNLWTLLHRARLRLRICLTEHWFTP